MQMRQQQQQHQQQQQLRIAHTRKHFTLPSETTLCVVTLSKYLPEYIDIRTGCLKKGYIYKQGENRNEVFE
jgi:hypothetical protein